MCSSDLMIVAFRPLLAAIDGSGTAVVATVANRGASPSSEAFVISDSALLIVKSEDTPIPVVVFSAASLIEKGRRMLTINANSVMITKVHTLGIANFLPFRLPALIFQINLFDQIGYRFKRRGTRVTQHVEQQRLAVCDHRPHRTKLRQRIFTIFRRARGDAITWHKNLVAGRQ